MQYCSIKLEEENWQGIVERRGLERREGKKKAVGEEKRIEWRREGREMG